MSDPELTIFCRQVRERSKENRTAIQILHRNALTGNIMGILRQELDSMIRCIFLLSVADMQYRKQLIHDSISGKAWRTKDGKRKITDKEMVDLSKNLHGWTQNLYTFGCGFIHLSAFHDYKDRDPFESLTSDERHNIAHYLHYYHGFVMNDNAKLRDIVYVLPGVFQKISDNLECYVKDLEAGSNLRP
jgi:hypothetical protein